MDERRDDAAMISLITEIHKDVKTLDGKLSAHIQDETASFENVVKSLMSQAFPDGDLDGHRRRHEAELKKLEARAEFWKKMVYQLTEKGLFAFLGWIIYVFGKSVYVALATGSLKP